MSEIYRLTPRQVRTAVVDCIKAGLVPYVHSSPGAGKSSIMGQIANDFNLQMIDHRLSTSDPVDMQGLPRFVEGKAVFSPFKDMFPTEDMPLPEGKQGWMLFLDELGACSKAVQVAAYKLILDKVVGQHKLHPNVAITAAGNLSTDKAFVNKLSTAMESRLIHLEMVVDFEEWLYDVALPNKYDSRIIAFLNQYPSKLMDFRPDHQDKTFCCPRTWEFTNKLIKDQKVSNEKIPLLAGTITSGAAVDFVQFCQLADEVVTVKDICSNPNTCPIPDTTSGKWAVISAMMEKVHKDVFTEFCTYVERFSMDFKILFYRASLANNVDLRDHPSFRQALQNLQDYLE